MGLIRAGICCMIICTFTCVGSVATIEMFYELVLGGKIVYL